MGSTALYILLLLSAVASLALAPRLLRVPDPLPFKIALGLILVLPVVGPLFFLWLFNWPSRTPSHLDGRGAGLGRRYIETTQAPSGEPSKVLTDIEIHHNRLEADERSRRKSPYERLREKRKLRARQAHNKAKQAGTR